MKKWLLISLRCIPVLLVTPLFFIVELIHDIGPIGNEPFGRANTVRQAKTQELFIAIWGWAITGTYERDRFKSEFYDEYYKPTGKMSFHYIFSIVMRIVLYCILISVIISSY